MGEGAMSRNKDYLDKLNQLRIVCVNRKEDTLLFYLDCLLKLHYAFIKIEDTEMLSYIRQIVSPSLPLVEKYFIERTEAYLNPDNDKLKVKILEDIENSIISFSEVCETITQSTNSADRMLIQSAPIELGLTMSPVKICAYCSSLLNELAKIYRSGSTETDTAEYAFSVSPSLVSLPRETLLFSSMPDRGKVGVIKIPGKDISDIRHLRMQISHEFYHIVPGSGIRNRKERARLLAHIIMYDLFPRLYRGMELDEKQKIRLNNLLYKGVSEDITNNYLDGDDADRKYYSSYTQSYYVDYFMKLFCKMMALDSIDISGVLFGERKAGSLFEYEERMEKSAEYLSILRDNIMAMFRNDNVIKKYIKGHSDIMREIFADLLCVLSFRVKPEEFCSSFRYNPKSGDEDLNFDFYARIALVIMVMSRKENLDNVAKEDSGMHEFFRNWQNWNNTDWEHSVIINDDEMSIEGNTTFSNSDGFYNFEGMKQVMINVQTVIRKYEQKESVVNVKGRERETDVVQSGDTAWHSDDENSRILMFSSPRILEKYIDYCSLCLDDYLEFERNNRDRIEAFRNNFFVEEKSNMGILCKISRNEWMKLE